MSRIAGISAGRARRIVIASLISAADLISSGCERAALMVRVLCPRELSLRIASLAMVLRWLLASDM